MLARLKGASRACRALVWALVVLFALAPAVGMASAAPAGAFSRAFLHIHEHADEGHVHHGHHHEHGDRHYGDGDHSHHDGAAGDDPAQSRLHVHHEACCPSMDIPVAAPEAAQYRLAGRLAISPVEPMQGAPPGRLLRPPISLS
jgi:hypothetical protein